jgi:sulfotransferase
MVKKIFYNSSMPRAGSTLIQNILGQNPEIHVTPTSGLYEMLISSRTVFTDGVEFKAQDQDLMLEGFKGYLKGSIYGFFNNITDKPYVIDKSRGWLAYLEMAKELVDNDVKVLVPVRDYKQVISSWEKLYRKNAKLNQSGIERTDYFLAQTTQGRANVLFRNDQPIGLAHNRIIDALQRGWGKHMFFVDYDDLTHNPDTTMKAIYDFLGEDYFAHDFNNVKQVTQSDDAIYGFKDLHKIRSEVKPQPEDWKEVLGEWAKESDRFNFWKVKNNGTN